MSYTTARPRATAFETPLPSRRDEFARAAVFAEFHFKHAVALDQAGFVDRRPHEQPRPAPDAWQRETDSSKWPGLVTRRAA